MLHGPAFNALRRRLVTLRFPATETCVREALLTVDAALESAGAPTDLRTRAQIVLAEACNNIVEHAYRPPCDWPDASITLDVAADHGGLQVTLRDKGLPMTDGPLPGRALPPLDPTDVQNLPEGGFGWSLLREMTRALSLSRNNAQNILRFRVPHTETPGPITRNVV